MKKAHINSLDSETSASDYMVKIIYADGEVREKRTANYSYSNVFDEIKESHEGENDRKVKSINIELVRWFKAPIMGAFIMQ